MRIVAIILGAFVLAAGAAFAATSLLDNASGTDDPVGNLSPVGSVGSGSTSTEDGTTSTDETTTEETTTEDTTTEGTTTEGTTTDDHGGDSGNRGPGGGGEDD
jgi:hypothetical protein